MLKINIFADYEIFISAKVIYTKLILVVHLSIFPSMFSELPSVEI